MEDTDKYNAVIDELLARLTLMENSGVEYIGLGPVNALEILFNNFAECTLCPRHANREEGAGIIRGSGGIRAEIVIVSSFEITGKEPRELLEKMINAMGLDLNDLYITSVVKCTTKDPGFSMDSALKSCKPLLLRELEIVSPRVVIALGEQAAKALIDTPLKFNSIRGRFQESAATSRSPFQIMPTHPLDLLAGDRDKKKECWSDLKKVMAKLKLTPVKQ